MTNKLLHDIYYSPGNTASFDSKNKLFEAARERDKFITQKDVDEWLQQQTTYTLHKPARRIYKRNRVISKRVNEQFQADLVDLKQFHRFNNGYKYLLTVIDVFSKYAFVIPIKDKSSKEICKAFKIIFAQQKSLKLQTDKEKEFVNNEFKSLCQDLKINFITSSDGETKCSVTERFNRTLKEKMFKYFTFEGTRKYIDILSTLVTTYNNTIHS